MSKRRYGTHPDIPDHRDHYFKPPATDPPVSVDLRPHCPPIYNQQRLNSCSANAIAAALWFEARKQNRRCPSPSRLFIYFNERAREHRIEGNLPVSLRDGYKSVISHGVCAENLWPYRVHRFRERPHRTCYSAARLQRVVSYARLHRKLDSMKGCLALGHPFTVGISVHESFEQPRMKHSGRGALPRRGERLLGGHAVVVVGYNDAHQRFILRNSWGRQWGLQGYFTLPYDYLLHESLAWDFWMLRPEQA